MVLVVYGTLVQNKLMEILRQHFSFPMPTKFTNYLEKKMLEYKSDNEKEKKNYNM